MHWNDGLLERLHSGCVYVCIYACSVHSPQATNFNEWTIEMCSMCRMPVQTIADRIASRSLVFYSGMHFAGCVLKMNIKFQALAKSVPQNTNTHTHSHTESKIAPLIKQNMCSDIPWVFVSRFHNQACIVLFWLLIFPFVVFCFMVFSSSSLVCLFAWMCVCVYNAATVSTFAEFQFLFDGNLYKHHLFPFPNIQKKRFVAFHATPWTK